MTWAISYDKFMSNPTNKVWVYLILTSVSIGLVIGLLIRIIRWAL